MQELQLLWHSCLNHIITELIAKHNLEHNFQGLNVTIHGNEIISYHIFTVTIIKYVHKG